MFEQEKQRFAREHICGKRVPQPVQMMVEQVRAVVNREQKLPVIFVKNGRVLRVINLKTICEHEEVVDDIRGGGDAAEVPQSRADPTIMVMLRRFPRAEQIP